MEYTLLSELSLQQKKCKLKVRICRFWESTAPFLKGDIFSLDCLLVDEQGYSLQGTIRKQDAEGIRYQITEGNVYLIEKFNVVPNKKKYAAVNRDYMVQINKWTSLTLVEEDNEKFPLYSFNFLSFSQLEKQRNNDAVLTDVLGQLTSISDVTHRYVGQTLTAIRNLQIQDLERNELSVTLWDKFASDFNNAYILEKEKEGNKPIVIVLAGMTIRSFRENIYASSCSASKIYLDLEIPEVTNMLQSLQVVNKSIERIDTSHEPIMSPQEEMYLNRKNVAGLFDLDLSILENTKFTCQAKIVEIDTSFGWWYKACNKCKASVKTYDDTFYCSNCNENDQGCIPWYKLHTVVEDSSGSMNFTIFGKVAQDLIHIPAQILATSAGADQFTLSPPIKSIIGQEHVFQIIPDTLKFRSNTPSFKVTKNFPISCDTKGKSHVEQTLVIKCEEQQQSPATNKQLNTDIFTEISSDVEISSSSGQCAHNLSDIQHSKKRRLTFNEATASNEQNK